MDKNVENEKKDKAIKIKKGFTLLTIFLDELHIYYLGKQRKQK
jgi:hypothetical protein